MQSPKRTEVVPTDTDSPGEFNQANVIFKKMVISDKEQNKRLSMRINGHKSKCVSDGKKVGGRIQGTRIRFLICTLGLFVILLSQMSRIILNVCITSMIDPEMLAPKSEVSSDGSCPVAEPVKRAVRSIDPTGETTAAFDPILDFFTDSSTEQKSEPSSEATNLMAAETISIVAPTPDKFKWTIKQQSLLLGGFYYSYFVVMIFAGRMAEKYGSKYIILSSIAGSAIINLTTPWMARNSFTLLVASRIILGSVQSGVYPALYGLFGKWLTLTEASIYTPLIKMCLKGGTLLASILPGLLSDWADVFYATGLVSAMVALAWLFVATSNPEDNSWVSEKEVKHITRKKNQLEQVKSVESGVELGEMGKVEKPELDTKKKSAGVPWLKILTSPSVIGLCLGKMAVNLASDWLAIELPSYLKYVHHSSKETISLITSLVAIFQTILVIMVGWMAKIVVVKKPFGVTRTVIRKLFQGVANFSLAITFTMITLDSCNLTYVAVLLQFSAVLMVFGVGGEMMLPYDLSDEYLATIASIANSAANTTGATVTMLTGLVLGDQGGNYKRWNIMLWLVALVNLIGGLSFCSMVEAERMNFEPKEKKKFEQKEQAGTENRMMNGSKQVSADELDAQDHAS